VGHRRLDVRDRPQTLETFRDTYIPLSHVGENPVTEQGASSEREVLAGLVERVTFHNAENGFAFCGSRRAATAIW
jgi:hypothetical protein